MVQRYSQSLTKGCCFILCFVFEKNISQKYIFKKNPQKKPKKVSIFYIYSQGK